MLFAQTIDGILPASDEVITTHRRRWFSPRRGVIDGDLRRQALGHGWPIPLVKGKKKAAKDIIDLYEDIWIDGSHNTLPLIERIAQ